MVFAIAQQLDRKTQMCSRAQCTLFAILLPEILCLSPAPAPAIRVLPASVCFDNKVRYFAFGSNLLQSKMEGRGKTEVLDRTPAVVTDHRLAFNMRMFPPLEPAMASLEPSEGDLCEGALYTLTRDGYEALWKSEGGAMTRPGYEEIVVNASVGGGETVQAITFTAAPWIRLNRDVPPSARYKKLIVDGAKEVGLSNEYIARMETMPSASPSAALTAIARAHGVVAVLLFRLKLRKLLAPVRLACYALLRARGNAAGPGSRLLDVGAEVATCAVLLPTATLGFMIRSILRLFKLENLVRFGPPAQNSTQKTDPAASKP